uniref:Small ribosomal subunit protein uS10m n=1 Tax=Parascaris equorum TaxID=6256 RepID=A0A914RTE8_PAREQ
RSSATACHHLSIECGPVKALPYVRWIQPLLRSKFVHKKYKLHYETRTHIRCMTISDVTGSTASTFLEYIERNIPEGVAMKVTYEELLPFPQMIAETMEKEAGVKMRIAHRWLSFNRSSVESPIFRIFSYENDMFVDIVA